MLARREIQCVDDRGNIIKDTQVEVRREVAGQPLAAIYADRDGSVPLGNPFPVDAETGVGAFHAAGGSYRIRAFTTGGLERIMRYVPMGLLAEGDDASDVALVPAGDIEATNVQDAAEELDDEKLSAGNIASDAQIRAATAGSHIVSAERIATASELETLADAATVAFDWAAGINFELEITDDRVLGNPTNGQPGTWRTILLESDGGPDELTFGDQYWGPAVDNPPVPNSTDTEYLLAIYCVHPTYFIATAVEVKF